MIDQANVCQYPLNQHNRRCAPLMRESSPKAFGKEVSAAKSPYSAIESAMGGSDARWLEAFRMRGAAAQDGRSVAQFTERLLEAAMREQGFFEMKFPAPSRRSDGRRTNPDILLRRFRMQQRFRCLCRKSERIRFRVRPHFHHCI